MDTFYSRTRDIINIKIYYNENCVSTKNMTKRETDHSENCMECAEHDTTNLSRSNRTVYFHKLNSDVFEIALIKLRKYCGIEEMRFETPQFIQECKSNNFH